MSPKKSPKPLTCNFCGKSEKEVRILILGIDAYICDECVAFCNEILFEEFGEEQALIVIVVGPDSDW